MNIECFKGRNLMFVLKNVLVKIRKSGVQIKYTRLHLNRTEAP